MNNAKKFNTIMVVAVAIIAVMSIGYAIFSANLTLAGTGNITGRWGVAFNKTDYTVEGTATDNSNSPSIDTYSVDFDINFAKPGDSKTYTFNIENTGNIDAILQSVKLTTGESNSSEIAFTYSVSNGENVITNNSNTVVNNTYAGLAATNGKHKLTVTITYVSSDNQQDTSDPNFVSTAEYTLLLTYVQAS